MEIQILDWLQKLHAGSGQDYVFDYEAWGRGDSVDPSGSGSAFDPEDEKGRIDPGRGAGCGCSPLQCDFKASGS